MDWYLSLKSPIKCFNFCIIDLLPVSFCDKSLPHRTVSFWQQKATKVNVAAGFGHKSMVGGVNFLSVRHCNILSRAVGKSGGQ